MSCIDAFLSNNAVRSPRFMPLSSTTAVDEAEAETLAVLYRAADTKTEDSDAVVAALLDLEKMKRQAYKESPAAADSTLEALSGGGGSSWRLVFTTGTIDTQKKTGRVNYFPIKATQSFNKETDPWLIENGIYLGDFPIVKFKGDFDWTVQKSGVAKLTFDFTSIKLFNSWEIQLKAGEAASIGAKTGLGSKSNEELEKRGKRPFFNWIIADSVIACARGTRGKPDLQVWNIQKPLGADSFSHSSLYRWRRWPCTVEAGRLRGRTVGHRKQLR